MAANVFDMVRTLPIRFVAYIALVRFFACVRPQVAFEDGLDGKRLVADGALERTLAGVRAHVDCQVRLLGEAAAADFAF